MPAKCAGKPPNAVENTLFQCLASQASTDVRAWSTVAQGAQAAAAKAVKTPISVRARPYQVSAYSRWRLGSTSRVDAARGESRPGLRLRIGVDEERHGQRSPLAGSPSAFQHARKIRPIEDVAPGLVRRHERCARRRPPDQAGHLDLARQLAGGPARGVLEGSGHEAAVDQHQLLVRPSAAACRRENRARAVVERETCRSWSCRKRPGRRNVRSTRRRRRRAIGAGPR